MFEYKRIYMSYPLTLSEFLMYRLKFIAEILSTQKLTILRRATLFNEQKKIYERLFPGTTKGAVNKGNNYGKDINVKNVSYVEYISQLTGISGSTIYEDIQLANKIKYKAKERIWNTKYENNKGFLNDLAKLNTRGQLYITSKLNEPKETVFNLLRKKIEEPKRKYPYIREIQINSRLSKEYTEKLDQKIKIGGFKSRAELLRTLVKNYMKYVKGEYIPKDLEEIFDNSDELSKKKLNKNKKKV